MISIPRNANFKLSRGCNLKRTERLRRRVETWPWERSFGHCCCFGRAAHPPPPSSPSPLSTRSTPASPFSLLLRFLLSITSSSSSLHSHLTISFLLPSRARRMSFFRKRQTNTHATPTATGQPGQVTVQTSASAALAQTKGDPEKSQPVKEREVTNPPCVFLLLPSSSWIGVLILSVLLVLDLLRALADNLKGSRTPRHLPPLETAAI